MKPDVALRPGGGARAMWQGGRRAFLKGEEVRVPLPLRTNSNKKRRAPDLVDYESDPVKPWVGAVERFVETHTYSENKK